MDASKSPLKGRGSQGNPHNRFQKLSIDTEETDGIDIPLEVDPRTQVVFDHPKKILNKVKSPDIPCDYSLNPYQGCEHGCTYCYAREAHEYWGYSAGLDFERIIIVKEEAPTLLAKELSHPKWKPSPVMFSGNTDCYQPIERKYLLTRQCLEVFWKFRNPVSLITKNNLVLRDLDILSQMAHHQLVHVAITITTLDESLRRNMEPRTSSTKKRLETVRKLSEAGIPVMVMLGPIIPGLNNHEFPQLVEQVAEAGASNVGYTFVRLNGSVANVFENWLRSCYPDRADKVLNQIAASHGGSLGSNKFGSRMRGEGPIASSIRQVFGILKKKYFADREWPAYNLDAFQRPGQMSLF